MEGNIPQRVVSVGSNEYYSTRYVMENIISGYSMGAIYGRLKRYGDPPVTINGILYWSLEQARLALQSFEDDVKKEKECLSNGFMTMRMIAETLPKSVDNKAVYRYLRSRGFEHVAEANISGQRTFFYDKTAIVACQEHFSNKESKTIEKPNKMVDRSHEDYRRENAILMDRIRDEKDRNNKLEKKIERHNRTINQLKDEIRSRDRSISGYKGAVKSLQKRLENQKVNKHESETKVADQEREKLYTIREMAGSIDLVNSVNPKNVRSSIYSFLRSRNIKPTGKENRSFLYDEDAFEEVRKVYDKETVRKEQEKISAQWEKNMKELTDKLALADEAEKEIKLQKQKITTLSFELANKNKIIANLEAEIDSYKKKNEELETLRNNVGVVSRIKRIFT